MQAVLFVGIQGSGKSTFFRTRFFDTHVRINLDMLRTRHREAILLRACVEGKQPFVVDNTNPTPADRARYIAPAKAARFRVVGYYFASPLADAIGRNERRPPPARVPLAGLLGTHGRLQVPDWAEGFDELYCVRIAGAGAAGAAEPEVRPVTPTFVVEPWEPAAGPKAPGEADSGEPGGLGGSQ